MSVRIVRMYRPLLMFAVPAFRLTPPGLRGQRTSAQNAPPLCGTLRAVSREALFQSRPRGLLHLIEQHQCIGRVREQRTDVGTVHLAGACETTSS